MFLLLFIIISFFIFFLCPKKIEISACQQTIEPVLWTWPKPSYSSSSLLVLLIHLTEKRQYSRALVSSSYSKFFLHKEKVIGLVK